RGPPPRLRSPNIPPPPPPGGGHRLVTSGIGGRFPAGFPVGVVESLHPDDTRLFVVAEVRPAARLDRGLEVLLVSNAVDETRAGPDVPPPEVAEPGAEAGEPADAAATPPAGTPQP
ncbi:MAG: rod shape-determining protein MreC, partial [Arenimonas sp.]|uniref:rod shape-determining protein MreC n=1 Tax=Arenimonas sp. TaxID=1872635 RepID=UPI0025BF1570